MFVLCSLLAICRPLLPLLIYFASPWYQKAKIGLRMSLQTKTWLITTSKDFIKQPEMSNFSQFFFPYWLLHRCFLSLPIRAFANFEKLIRFHWQAFIVYKYWENLKKLIEIFCQKLIVSNVIMAFLDHLEPNIFFVG